MAARPQRERRGVIAPRAHTQHVDVLSTCSLLITDVMKYKKSLLRQDWHWRRLQVCARCCRCTVPKSIPSQGFQGRSAAAQSQSHLRVATCTRVASLPCTVSQVKSGRQQRDGRASVMACCCACPVVSRVAILQTQSPPHRSVKPDRKCRAAYMITALQRGHMQRRHTTARTRSLCRQSAAAAW